MHESKRYLLALLAGLALAAAAWSQDSGSAAQVEPEAAGDEPAEAVEPETADEEAAIEIDDESYIDIEEDDFRPSEEIDADQSIPFPTDI